MKVSFGIHLTITKPSAKLFLAIVCITLSCIFSTAHATGRWTAPQKIPGFDRETAAPLLTADPSCTVHALSSQWVNKREDRRVKAIAYNRWTPADGWTQPHDVLVSPLKDQARLLGAFLDNGGTLHVVFFGGDNTWANIYYAKAPAVSADLATSWSAPVMVGEKALDPENGAVIGDDKGNLAIIYSSSIRGNGLYAIYSEKGEDRWSAPEAFYQTDNAELWPYGSRISPGKSGRMHFVWNIVDRQGHGKAGYYASLDLGQRRWSRPIEVAKGVNLGAFNPNVIEHLGTIFLTYYNGDVNSNWWRLSRDEGETWTPPKRLSADHIGFNGRVALVVDSLDVLHLLYGERIPKVPATHGLWHVTWQDGRMSRPEAVVYGPRVADLEGGSGFDPSGAEAVACQENVLMVTWVTDPGAGKNGVWFSRAMPGAPGQPPTRSAAPHKP